MFPNAVGKRAGSQQRQRLRCGTSGAHGQLWPPVLRPLPGACGCFDSAAFASCTDARRQGLQIASSSCCCTAADAVAALTTGCCCCCLPPPALLLLCGCCCRLTDHRLLLLPAPACAVLVVRLAGPHLPRHLHPHVCHQGKLAFRAGLHQLPCCTSSTKCRRSLTVKPAQGAAHRACLPSTYHAAAQRVLLLLAADPHPTRLMLSSPSLCPGNRWP